MVASLEEEIILILKFLLNKKAAIVSNFCLIGKISHDFLILRSIESAQKTFIGIQVKISVEWAMKRFETLLTWSFETFQLLKDEDTTSNYMVL